MPRSVMTCEFCKTKGENYECRGDALAGHVRSKHIPEIKTMLFREYLEYADKAHNYSTLRKMMDGRCPPIYSELYEHAEFWMGVKPNIFMDEEIKAQTAYNASQMNMDAHQEFLNEIMDSITLKEMIVLTKDFNTRTNTFVDLKRKLMDAEKLITSMQDDTQKSDALIESLKQDIRDFKELGDVQQSVAMMKSEIHSLRSLMHSARKDADDWKVRCRQMEEDYEKQLISLREEKNIARNTLESQLFDVDAKNRDLEATIKRKINDGVAKEMEKMRKEKEKEKEKKRKEEKKAKEAMKLAKMKAKLKKRKGDSDSDSDLSASSSSSSDSDSD